MLTIRAILVIAISASIGGCSGGGSGSGGSDSAGIVVTDIDTQEHAISTLGDNLSGDITQWGVVKFENGYRVDGKATFINVDPAVADYRDIFREYSHADDTCTVRVVGGLTVADSTFNIDLLDDFVGNLIFHEVSLLNAGDEITVNGLSGEVGVFNRSERNGYRLSITDAGGTFGILVAPLLDGTRVSVPGGEFPGFPDVSVPFVDRMFSDNSMRDENRTASSPVRWQPGTNPNARIRLVQVFDDVERSVRYQVKCMLVDDGDYAFPAAIQQRVGDSVAARSVPNLHRVAFNILQSGTSALVIFSESSQ